MKILHTSDWHIGRTLFGRKRIAEFEAFLSWLVETLLKERVDVLLVAGDVFDNSTPSNLAQELYYRFLCRVAVSSCRHVVVIAGNHDSPSFLNAPRELLRALDVHVIGAATDSPGDEVLLLMDPAGLAELIVCAVPYLRDRDIRVAEAGESIGDKERKLIDGIRSHYADVCDIAKKMRESLGVPVPIIAMGHLFTAGGKTVEGDGVRELYVGSLAHVSPGVFPECIDYLALGHLHVAQTVNGSELMRYSGSPLPMGVGEASREKSVCLVEFVDRAATVRVIPVPVFQKIEGIRGEWNDIATRIRALSASSASVWVEIIYEGDAVIGDLRERLDSAVAGTRIEILRVKNTRGMDRVLGRNHDEESLDDLSAEDVFERCLTAHDVPEAQRPELLRAYREAIATLHEDDTLAE
jgi:DNA repair protein SbcD/Mre11